MVTIPHLLLVDVFPPGPLPAKQPGAAGTATPHGFPDRYEDDGSTDSDEKWNPGDSAIGIVVPEVTTST